ncbi:MAG: inorganic phosphate transporter [Verrucomicrobiae bacterium]|nr:inorganic phosphate transporter [Verrucomicrobiae bacterium]
MEHFFRDISDIFHHPYIALIFITALVFDFVNGFHDAANSIATVVGTRVLRPFQAVCWAAFWNFAAAFLFGVGVANAVAKWVHIDYINSEVIFAGLLGAIVWNLTTWFFGLPSSSSHALLGGLGGAAIACAGKWAGVLNQGKVIVTLEFIVIAPLIGLVLGLFFIASLMWLLRKVSPWKVDRTFRMVQLVSAAAYSLGHGTNDAQKTMGIIAALLYASIWQDQQHAFETGKIHFPYWIIMVCYITISLGTMAGGWRIIKTMGMKITKLRPYSGACAELAAATSLFLAAKLGIPVSTTHTITGAIIGVGAVQRLSAVRWGVARQVVWAWVLTVPAAGVVGAGCYWLLATIKN